MDVQPTQNSNKKLLWIIIGAIVVFAVAVGVVLAFVMKPSTPQTASTAPSPSASPEASVATKEQVKQNMSDLSESIKQAQSDQAAAKAALNDAKNQIKVGS